MDLDTAPDVLYARLLPRIKAMIVDLALYVAVVTGFVLVVSATTSQLVLRTASITLVALILLYEPVMVWRVGGTLGHLRQNLRVVSDSTSANPGLLACIARWFVKGTLGVFSLLFMALTRRHQGLHDIASRSTVRARSVAQARDWDFTTARSDPVGPVDVSVSRRIAVTLAYELLLFLVLSVGTAPFVSDACIFENRCTPEEDILSSATGIIWMVAAAVLLLLGWKGRLYGARSKAT